MEERKEKFVTKFSYWDREGEIFVETVRRGSKVCYLVVSPTTNEFTFRDEYLVENENLLIRPPELKHPALIKEGIILPQIQTEEGGELDKLFAGYDEGIINKQLREFVERWIIVPDAYLTVLAAFVKHTWTHERSFIKGHLNIWGDKGTGKSTVIETSMCYVCRFAHYYAGGVTPAALLRHIEEIRGTSIVDEADYIEGEDGAKIRMILRAGYKANGNYTLTETANEKKHTPQTFTCGNPKIIIGREPMRDDALRSRCIELEMKPQPVPKNKRRNTEIWFEEKLRGEAQGIVNSLFLYRLKHLADKNELEKRLENFEARLADTAGALWWCVDEAERQIYLDFINKDFNEQIKEKADSMNGRILTVLKQIIEDRMVAELSPGNIEQFVGDIFIEDLLKKYKGTFDREMSENDFQKFLNPWKLGKKLKKMGLNTERKWRGEKNDRIIRHESFRLLPEIFTRYGVDVDSDDKKSDSSLNPEAKNEIEF